MAPVGDVRVELGVAGREALGVLAVAHHRLPARYQQRPGLQQVAGRLRGYVGAAGDGDLALARVHARARVVPRREEGLGHALMPRVRTSPSGRPDERMKKPPTTASLTAWRRHHPARVSGRRSTTARRSVWSTGVAGDVDSGLRAVRQRSTQPGGGRPVGDGVAGWRDGSGAHASSFGRGS
jgi:hypothetical protein